MINRAFLNPATCRSIIIPGSSLAVRVTTLQTNVHASFSTSSNTKRFVRSQSVAASNSSLLIGRAMLRPEFTLTIKSQQRYMSSQEGKKQKKKKNKALEFIWDGIKRLSLDIFHTIKATTKGQEAARKHAQESKKPKPSNALQMSEARLILGVDANVTYEEAKSRFEVLFANNDEKNGGSFYIQSKVHNAWELLQEEGLAPSPQATADTATPKSASPEEAPAPEPDVTPAPEARQPEPEPEPEPEDPPKPKSPPKEDTHSGGTINL